LHDPQAWRRVRTVPQSAHQSRGDEDMHNEATSSISDSDSSDSRPSSNDDSSKKEELPNPPIPEPPFSPKFEEDVHGITEDEENPFSRIAVPGTSRVKQIWAIGGGKGGVGKSLVASSLAISLARSGNKVVAIDLDLGAAN